MAPRITIVFAILAFTIVNIAGLFRGQEIVEVWLNSLIAMVGFAVLGFFLGLLYDVLIKEVMVQEDAMMFGNYLEDNPEAGGPNSMAVPSTKVEEPKEEESETSS